MVRVAAEEAAWEGPLWRVWVAFVPRRRDTGSDMVTIPIPEVDESLCTTCGECGRLCRYFAIVSFGTTSLVFPELCHGCSGCALVCRPAEKS